MNSPHESFVEIVKDLWRKNKALMIALGAAAAVLIYVLIKRSEAAAGAAAQPTPPPATGAITDISTYITKTVSKGQQAPPGTCKPGYHFQSSQLGQPIPSGSYAVQGGYCVPNAPPAPKPRKKQQVIGVVRPKATSGKNAGWDATHNGVPVRASPGGQGIAILSLDAFGSKVPLKSAIAISGGYNDQGGSTLWYQAISGGYISAADFASVTGG